MIGSLAWAPGEALARRLVLLAFVGPLLLAAAPQPVLAHGGEAGIVVEESRLLPGSRTTVRGEDLEPTTAVRLEMITASGPRTVAEGTTDGEGHLNVQFVAPEDVEARYYELRATLADGTVVSTYFAVVSPDDELLPATDTGLPDLSLLLVGTVFMLAVTAAMLHRGRSAGSREGSRLASVHAGAVGVPGRRRDADRRDADLVDLGR